MFNSTIFNKKFKIAFFLLLLLILIHLILLLIPKGKKTGKVNQGQTADQRQTVDNKNSINQKTSEKKLLYDLSSTQALPSPKNEDNYKEAKKITLAPEIAPKNISSEEKLKIAENVVNWLTALKQNENGEEIFSIGYICNPGKPCEKAPTDRQVTFPVIWAMYHYYLKTKKPETLNLIKQIINSYSDRPLQPDFWHCKILYEMRYPKITEKIFSKDEERKIDFFCNGELLLRRFLIEPISKEKNYRQFDSKTVIEQINQSNYQLEKAEELEPKDSRDFLIYISHAADLVSQASWFSNPEESLNLAFTYLNYSLLFFQNKRDISLVSLPYLTLSVLDFYKKTNNQNFLDLFNYLFEQSIKNRQENTFNLIGIALLLKEKYQLTQNFDLINQLNEIINYLINNGYDEEGYNGFRNGLKAFHSLGKNGYLYDTRNNALLLYLITNEKF